MKVKILKPFRHWVAGVTVEMDKGNAELFIRRGLVAPCEGGTDAPPRGPKGKVKRGR